ncbi:MAG: heme/hemin ABC transporter substrate-binding protein [Bacteroidota bacterium]
MKNYLIITVVGAFLLSCGRFANEDKKENHPERIVCLAKQYTEIIFALGAEKDLAAVDLSSTFPEKAKKLPTVGYHRALTIEGILAQKPSLILHDDNIGPPAVVEQLEKLKIPMKVFETKGSTLDSTKILIREMGKYFGKEDKAEALCEKLTKDLAESAKRKDEIKKEVKVLIIHFGQATNVFLAVTEKSVAAQMIEMAGGKVAVQGKRGMKHLSPEVIAAADPDVIILTDVGYDRLGSIDKIKEIPGLGTSKAAKNNKIYRFEEHDIIYFGPRTGENIIKLQKLIHQ